MTGRGDREPQPAGEEPDDSGMTLVEVLVAIALFSVLGTLLLGLALSTSRVGQDTQRIVRIDEDARLAFERMAREFRQASRVAVAQADQLSDGTFTAVNVTVTFDEPTEAVPEPETEMLRYEWHPDGASGHHVTLTRLLPTHEGPSVLATNVVDFSIELRSSRWEFDGSIPDQDADSVATWQEIDHARGGDEFPDPDELALIDRLAIDMTVDDGTTRRTFTTEVFLRNAEVPQ